MLDKISFIGDNTMYQIYEFKKKNMYYFILVQALFNSQLVIV